MLAAMSADTTDLRPLLEQEGPYLSMIVPAPSQSADAAQRFEIECKNVLKEVSADWPEDDAVALDAALHELPHDAGDAVIAIRRVDGLMHVEFIENGVDQGRLDEGPLPRLAPLIEARQRTIAHVMVDTDLSGADITAFDGGTVIATEGVDGETEHIHRGHPGGWSQRRFQQRAENTWDDNANDVADAAATLAEQTNARLIVVVGPTRAQSMVADALCERTQIPVEKVEAGEVDDAAAEITRLTANVAATDVTDLLDQVREGVGTGRSSTSSKQVLEALEQGRVETLLVHDDDDASVTDTDGGPRLINRAIAAALQTDAAVHVVPNVALLDNGVAAILRW